MRVCLSHPFSLEALAFMGHQLALRLFSLQARWCPDLEEAWQVGGGWRQEVGTAAEGP